MGEEAAEAGAASAGAWLLPKSYLVFLGDARLASVAKTGIGVRQWARSDCIGQWRLDAATVDIGLPDLVPSAAHELGARSLLIGVAPVGGGIPDDWMPHLLRALEAGLDIVSGLHVRLGEDPALACRVQALGRRIFDIRHPRQSFPVATGRKRTGKRLLTVGTDCALGKKYTALAVAMAMQARGHDATFRATGQTGIMIAGSGIAIDAVVADFLAGAAECLSPDAGPDHWDVIEGQGSLFHPAYAGVTLGLLHGSQADALILCHEAGRSQTAHFEGFPLPALTEAIAAYLPLARRTNPAAQFVGISLNTGRLPLAQAHQQADEIGRATGLPVCDPLRFGLDAVLDRMMACA